MKPFVALLKRMRSRFGAVEKVMGVLLVLTGIAFLTGWITNMSFWLLETRGWRRWAEPRRRRPPPALRGMHDCAVPPVGEPGQA